MGVVAIAIVVAIVVVVLKLKAKEFVVQMAKESDLEVVFGFFVFTSIDYFP